MSGGQSYMQQNTRLVVLTLEVRLLLLGPLLSVQASSECLIWPQSLIVAVKFPIHGPCTDLCKTGAGHSAIGHSHSVQGEGIRDIVQAVRESGMAIEAQLEPSVLTSAAGEDSMSSGSLDVTSSGGDSSSDEGPPLPPPAQYEVGDPPVPAMPAMPACLPVGTIMPLSHQTCKTVIYQEATAAPMGKIVIARQSYVVHTMYHSESQNCNGPQPTQWHTSATAEPPASAASESSRRVNSSQGASTSGRQPVDYLFSFLSSHRQQTIAAERQASGEHAADCTCNVDWSKVKRFAHARLIES